MGVLLYDGITFQYKVQIEYLASRRKYKEATAVLVQLSIKSKLPTHYWTQTAGVSSRISAQR